MKIDYRETAWWYWLVSWGLLVSGLAGWEPGFWILIGLQAVQVIDFAFREKSLTSFSVQVRIGFFLFVLIAYWPPLRFLYFIPAAGLLARVLVNYCLLARVMSLLPWNCSEPFSRSLVRRTLFTRPVTGSIVENRPLA